MDKDIVPDLLASIEADFEQSFGKSEVVAAAFEALKEKQATYKTVNELAIEVGDILSQALGASLSADKLPDGKMYYNIAKRLLEDTLGRNFDIVSGYARDVQQLLNERAGLGLKVQVPALNQDKIDGLVNRLSTADDFESVKWLLGDPIVTFTQGIVDDTIQENVEFHAKVGLSPKITREHVGNCCDWCRGLAGTYDYPKVPKDVYRRHGNCRCVVDYKPGDGKKKNVWSKKWSKESADVLEQRKQLNRDIRDNNRKADNEEFKKIVEVLGAKNAPTSVAKFQDLKYNDVEGYKELKDRVHWKSATFPTEKSFDGHFDTHAKEFGNISRRQYQQLAAGLLAEPTSETILGYETETRRVRYDRENNIIAVGKIGKNKNVKITTMFKPDEKEAYYYDDYKRENNHD
ncbi:hypothetical protein ABQH43_01610 [Streptococcus sp. ZJ100]|uniref:hypothetical protein n=1 Tax=Streptococcus handemini TaxID=3161188 RepID=UPI0032EB1B73